MIKNFLKKKMTILMNYVGVPTRFIKLQNLTRHLGGAEIWAKVVSRIAKFGGAHKIYHACRSLLNCKKHQEKKLGHTRNWSWSMQR
jgi:tryptophan synthase beta chain